MRTAMIAIVSAVLLLLAWLALDDITTGSEPSHALEWGVVTLTVLWFAVLSYLRLRPTESRQ